MKIERGRRRRKSRTNLLHSQVVLVSSLVRKHQKKIPKVEPLIPGVLAKKVSVAAHRLHQHECTFDQSHKWYKL